MRMATSSPKRSDDKRPIRLAGIGDGLEKRVLTHLPSTVTTRRPQSPNRRPPSSNGHHNPEAPKASDTPREPSSSTSSALDSKFFRASEAQQAARTPTSTSKPSFFTAKSFSAIARVPTTTPELRRAESAADVRSRPDSRISVNRTPTMRDLSPSRRPAHVTRTAHTFGDHSSPSPHTLTSPFVGREEVPKSKPRLPRQASMASLRSSTDSGVARKRLSGPGALQMAASQGKDMTSADLNHRTAQPVVLVQPSDIGTDITLSPEVEPISSPKSAASTSTSIPKSDSFDLSQPTQVNRKIMDLEIRNTSLLAVNNLLEKQGRKTAVEMKELRRRIVHMTKFPVSAVSDHGADSPRSLEDLESAYAEVDPDDSLQDVGDRLLEAANSVDQAIRRALLLTEQLLSDANRGLSYKPRESEIGVGVRRVLLAEQGIEDDSELMEDEERVEANESSLLGASSDLLPDDRADSIAAVDPRSA